MDGHRDDITDHDLLIRIDERVKKLDRCMGNHLRHHWVVTAAALTALLTIPVSLTVTWLATR